MSVLKQTFLIFHGADSKEAVYEVAIKCLGNKYVVLATEDILQHGLPISSKTSVPPFLNRGFPSLDAAVIYYNAYITEMQRSRLNLGWVLANLVEKSS